MDYKQFLFLDTMLTPKIITVIYWLLSLSVVVGGLVSIFRFSFFGGIGGIIFGLISVRIFCELLVVIFKIHENLKKIADKN